MCGFDSWPINRLREWCALLSSHLCHEHNQKSTCKQLILISKAVKKTEMHIHDPAKTAGKHSDIIIITYKDFRKFTYKLLISFFLYFAVIIMCTHTDVVREIMLMAYRQRLTTSNRLFFNIELFNSSSYGKALTYIVLYYMVIEIDSLSA